MKKDKKSQKPTVKKPVRQPKDLNLKSPINKPDLKKVVGAAGSWWAG